jgi:hypothetical protein
MDTHETPAQAHQAELFAKSEEFYWQFPLRRRPSHASMKYHRSGAAWWFRQMRVAAEQTTAIKTPPVAGQQPE